MHLSEPYIYWVTGQVSFYDKPHSVEFHFSNPIATVGMLACFKQINQISGKIHTLLFDINLFPTPAKRHVEAFCTPLNENNPFFCKKNSKF